MALTDEQIQNLSRQATPAERILNFFRPGPIDPEPLKAIEDEFRELGVFLLAHTTSGPEQTVAMRHLLDAKHAAVRSLIAVE